MAANYDNLGLAPGEGDGVTLRDLRGLLDRTKARYAERDGRMQDLLAVRQGRMSSVFPGLFPEGGPFADKSIAANMVDVAARDLAEVLSPLPSFNCYSSKPAGDRAKAFAEKRTKIAVNYVDFADSQTQMYTAADRYFSYGFVPAIVEIDTENQMPRIMWLDSVGAYPIYDRWGDVCAAYFVFTRSVDELVAEYPRAAGALQGTSGSAQVEVVRYHDKNVDMLFLHHGVHGLVLERAKNLAGECLVEWVARPGIDSETHGQFDDVLAIQVAKARFALLGLEAATKSVQAPIAVPTDIADLNFGPDAVLRTQNPEKVRRVPLDVPPAAFQQQGVLDQEQRQGSRYPDARTGDIDGSVVTGRGVQALMSGFDTQIRTGQAMFARAWARLVRKAFLVDEKVFGNVERTIRGNAQGAPYEITYTPSKDIKGDHTVDVQYGLMAGLDPNRALVFGLQARGDKIISREFMQENMPFAVDVIGMNAQIDIEDMRDALKQAVAGYAQAIPILAQQGQDPGEILGRLSQIILGRQAGKPIEDVVAAAFAPEVPEAGEPGVEQPGEGMAPGDAPPGGPGTDLPGLNDATGQLRGVAPGQAGLPPGGTPDMQMLLAGLTAAGKPNLAAGVSRRIPVS